MTDNATVIEALEKSVQKWKDITSWKKGIDKGAENCPLCELFFKQNCEGCPIMEKVGYSHCVGTPYQLWVRHQEIFHQNTTGDYRVMLVCENCAKEKDCDGKSLGQAADNVSFQRKSLSPNRKCENKYSWERKWGNDRSVCRGCSELAERMLRFLETLLEDKKRI